MRDLCIDTDNLETMAQNGEFVNNISIMTDIGNDSSFALDWLGGQNPIPVLLDSATQIDNSTITENDQAINDQLDVVVTSYINGDIASVADAEAAFIAAVEELGVV